MSASADRVIDVHDLRYAYRRGRRSGFALDGLSFQVGRGEIVGLLGPNGAGKTTAVRILATILRPGGGTASVCGHDVARQPLAARRQIAAVLQESAVETLLSTEDNLILYGYLHGLNRAETRRRMERVIDLMELRDQLTQRGGQLSGGYKRRLQVAKALMVETPVLFLDEATTGMDPMAKGRTMQAIRDQAKAGRTVLLTTQLLEEAESLCDRMILLDEGRSMAEGKLSELRAMARKSFTIGLGFATPDRAAVDALRGMGPVSLEERGGEVSMVVEGSEDQWIRNMARISERWPLVHFEIRGVTLEQIFIQMYGDARRARAEAPSLRGTVGGGGNGGATRAQESGPSEHGGGSPGTSGGSPPADPDRGGRGSR